MMTLDVEVGADRPMLAMDEEHLLQFAIQKALAENTKKFASKSISAFSLLQHVCLIRAPNGSDSVGIRTDWVFQTCGWRFHLRIVIG